MLFLALLLYVLLHNSAIRSQQQKLCPVFNYTCPYPRTTISNKIYGYSKGIAISPLYNRSDGSLTVNASCQSGSYLSITYLDFNNPGYETAYISEAQYGTPHCDQMDCYTPPNFCIHFVDSHRCLLLYAVDCLGKSLVALKLLPLLYVALHSSSDAIKS